MWHGISAWYPPTGLAFALFVGIGAPALPAVVLAGYVAGLINYHQSATSLEFLLINPVVPALYYLAARRFRKNLGSELRLRSMRDLLLVLRFSLVAAAASALFSAAVLVWSGAIPAHEYLRAAFNWGVGDAVALCSITPLILEFVMPFLFGFLGMTPPVSPLLPVPSSAERRKRFLKDAAFCVVLLSSLLMVFGPRANAHFFYLLFLPILWIAIRRGLRGAIVGIVILNTSVVLVAFIFPNRVEDLAFLQFLMLMLALTGLLLGFSTDERAQAQRHSEEEHQRMQLILESAAEGIYGIDPRGNCTFINPAAIHLLGYSSREQFLGKQFHTLCHHSHADRSPFPPNNAVFSAPPRMATNITNSTIFTGALMAAAFLRKSGLTPFSITARC